MSSSYTGKIRWTLVEYHDSDKFFKKIRFNNVKMTGASIDFNAESDFCEFLEVRYMIGKFFDR